MLDTEQVDTEELSVSQAGQLLNLTSERVKQLIACGELPCRRIGARRGMRLIKKADVLALDKRRKEQAAKLKGKSKSRKALTL